ncbi:translation initiation factor IF-2 [Tropilaelaps mercedesae]|uniref:Translation initiation factor IF-2 n=1 Tax=Tropilaelaps mercedesae TaxID=418985 RepID=A0A1V9XKB3_9ACAR|nr:translation initiation factor IF-2 [Tropilaelaps mercedesae]
MRSRRARKQLHHTGHATQRGGGDFGAGDAPLTLDAVYRICLVSDFFHPNTGGVETHIYQLAQCLLQRGHCVIVLTHAYGDRNGIRYLTNGLKVIHLPLWEVYSEASLPTLFCPSLLIRNVLIRERVQIVHTHAAFSSLALETLLHSACLGNIRSVFTDHSLFGFSNVSAVITNTLLKLSLHLADHVICVSEVGRMNTAHRARVSPDRICVVPNAVEFAMFTPASEPRQGTDIVIIVLCRLMYRKGIDLLAKVIPIVCERHPYVRFFIGGDGPKRILLEEVREHYKLQERVILRGNLRHNEVRDFLVSGDIFLNTSLTEAFCIAIVEAASCGLQVVSTNVGGIPYVLPPELIWLCSPSVHSLVEGLERAIIAKRCGTRRVSPKETNRRVSELYQWSSEMNIPNRLPYMWGSRCSIIRRWFTASHTLAAKKRIPAISIAKSKSKAPVVTIWSNITVKQLANVTKRPVDDIFEAIIRLPEGIDYEVENASLTQADALKILSYKCGDVLLAINHTPQILTLLGFRGKFGPAPLSVVGARLEEKRVHHDAKRQPPVKPEQLRSRRPVVTVMGHVDHGKTTLLDTLRGSHVVDEEFGGITQHIGAFSVRVPQCAQGAITFLDTPGHAAFSAMRARGANVTDMVVLVVAADDGVMEQTVESIRFANEAGVPIVVAVNKMDKHQADFDRSDREGGDVQFVPISALKGDGIGQLLEAIALQGEILDLKTSFEGLSEGHIIESSVHTHRGKVATVLVDRGILRTGSFLTAGLAWCKVRALFDEWGKPVAEVQPGCAAQVIGWKSLPNAGELMLEVENEKRAKEVSKLREEIDANDKIANDSKVIDERAAEERARYREALLAKWASGYRKKSVVLDIPKTNVDDKVPRLQIIIKGDADGSVEALLKIINTYNKNDECQLNIVHSAVGPVAKNDLVMAQTFKAIIYSMHVGTLPEIKAAIPDNVKIKEFKVRKNCSLQTPTQSSQT